MRGSEIEIVHSKKMLGCVNPNLGQIWTNPNVGLNMQLKKLQLKLKVEVGLKFEITFLTQYLGLSIFYPNLGSNNPALFKQICAVIFPKGAWSQYRMVCYITHHLHSCRWMKSLNQRKTEITKPRLKHIPTNPALATVAVRHNQTSLRFTKTTEILCLNSFIVNFTENLKQSKIFLKMVM